MRGSADMAGMPDVRSRRAFFRFEIARQDQPLEMKLESYSRFFPFRNACSSRPIFRHERSGTFFLWRFSALLLWPRFVAPIPTAEMKCILRPRGMHAKSSRQKHPILMHLF